MKDSNYSSGADKIEALSNANGAYDGKTEGKVEDYDMTKGIKKDSAADVNSAYADEYSTTCEGCTDSAVTYGGKVCEGVRGDYTQQVHTMHDSAAQQRKLKKEREQYQHRQKHDNDGNDHGGRKRERTPGIVGWLAAVISLGVTTLALATVVTYGWITMDNMQMNMAGVSRQSLYELNSIVDNLDADLARVRATTSTGDRVRTLTEIAIGSETAETVLERMPVQLQSTEQMASFLNKMGDSAKAMIYDLARGGELTSSQLATLEYMYETNKTVKEMVNKLATEADDMDFMNALDGKDNMLGSSFDELQNNTFETPKSIQDGPFADVAEDTNDGLASKLAEITPQDAEAKALKYFEKYNPTDVRCTGEAFGKKMATYNISIMTADGEMMAQLSKNGGLLLMFDSFKDCTQHNFDVERCIAIAEDFLSSVGYRHLVPVWTSENGTTCNLNFAPIKDGAILYPDMIKVKVCEERGIVTGVDCNNYVLNHGERALLVASIDEDRARESINGAMEIKGERLALIPLDGQEVLCYEFYGELGGNEYYVYVDAKTAEEVEVLTVIGTAQGRALM